MPKMNRDQMIEWLVDNDADYVLQTSGGLEWLRWTLTTGFEGYENMTDAQLREEILERDQDAFEEVPCAS